MSNPSERTSCYFRRDSDDETVQEIIFSHGAIALPDSEFTQRIACY